MHSNQGQTVRLQEGMGLVMRSGVCVGRPEQRGNPERSGAGAEVLGECPGEWDGPA